jgi:hypothetical protein
VPLPVGLLLPGPPPLPPLLPLALPLPLAVTVPLAEGCLMLPVGTALPVAHTVGVEVGQAVGVAVGLPVPVPGGPLPAATASPPALPEAVAERLGEREGVAEAEEVMLGQEEGEVEAEAEVVAVPLGVEPSTRLGLGWGLPEAVALAQPLGERGAVALPVAVLLPPAGLTVAEEAGLLVPVLVRLPAALLLGVAVAVLSANRLGEGEGERLPEALPSPPICGEPLGVRVALGVALLQGLGVAVA